MAAAGLAPERTPRRHPTVVDGEHRVPVLPDRRGGRLRLQLCQAPRARTTPPCITPAPAPSGSPGDGMCASGSGRGCRAGPRHECPAGRRGSRPPLSSALSHRRSGRVRQAEADERPRRGISTPGPPGQLGSASPGALQRRIRPTQSRQRRRVSWWDGRSRRSGCGSGRTGQRRENRDRCRRRLRRGTPAGQLQPGPRVFGLLQVDVGHGLSGVFGQCCGVFDLREKGVACQLVDLDGAVVGERDRGRLALVLRVLLPSRGPEVCPSPRRRGLGRHRD